MSDHISQKCDRCRCCFREGGEARRLGAVTITVWTNVGPFTTLLCGHCAAPVREVLSVETPSIEIALAELAR